MDSQPDRPQPLERSGNGAPAPRPSSHNLAARMGRWSSRHRKKAFWGWLAFVILAFAIGNAIGSTQISDVDQNTGESREAEAALDRAGLRPHSEVVFIQSDELTIEDPQFRAAVEDVTTRLPKIQYVENVKSPLNGESAVSEDGHAALVDFEIAGKDNLEARERVDPMLAAVASIQKQHPDLTVEQFGGVSANKAVNETISDDLKSAGHAVVADHADHPHDHVRDAGRGERAAAHRDHGRDGHPRPDRDSERDPARGRQSPGGHPADRPGGRSRLLALLSAARA